MTKVLGPLNYEVTIDGHSRQAHVDHLLPGTSNLDADSSIPDNEQADQEHNEKDDATTTTDNIMVPLVLVEVESNSRNDAVCSH